MNNKGKTILEFTEPTTFYIIGTNLNHENKGGTLDNLVENQIDITDDEASFYLNLNINGKRFKYICADSDGYVNFILESDFETFKENMWTDIEDFSFDYYKVHNFVGKIELNLIDSDSEEVIDLTNVVIDWDEYIQYQGIGESEDEEGAWLDVQIDLNSTSEAVIEVIEAEY